MYEALGSWRMLLQKITLLSEDEAKELLEYEAAHKKRVAVLKRLHQRYSALRVSRERIELFKEVGKVNGKTKTKRTVEQQYVLVSDDTGTENPPS